MAATLFAGALLALTTPQIATAQTAPDTFPAAQITDLAHQATDMACKVAGNVVPICTEVHDWG